MTLLERFKRRLRLEAFGLDFDKAAERVMVAMAKMGVVRGDGGRPSFRSWSIR
jgi:hypothetical protein